MNLAHLKSDCPFYDLFKGGQVPILNFLLPSLADCEGGGGVQNVYMVALDELEPAQFEALIDRVRLLAPGGPSIPREIVRKEIKARGLPLRAVHVASVSTDRPVFL